MVYSKEYTDRKRKALAHTAHQYTDEFDKENRNWNGNKQTIQLNCEMVFYAHRCRQLLSTALTFFLICMLYVCVGGQKLLNKFVGSLFLAFLLNTQYFFLDPIKIEFSNLNYLNFTRENIWLTQNSIIRIAYELYTRTGTHKHTSVSTLFYS